MKRIIATAAVIATMGLPAFAGSHTSEEGSMDMEGQMSMLRQAVQEAIDSCNIEGLNADDLTLAQASGVVLTGSSNDNSMRCQEIEALAK